MTEAEADRLDVTVLFLEGGHASTAIGPLEVFRSAGVLWHALPGTPTDAGDPPAGPRFRVRTASPDGRPVRPDGPYAILPDACVDEVGRTDLVFVPSAGLDLEAGLVRNRPAIDFLARAYAGGARVAGVCSGVALLAEAGLLDGRCATTHWALVSSYRARYPQVDWRPDAIVTESDSVYCGGGVYAALDLAVYLVEKLCGRELALQCCRSLVIDMPRTCQAGFAVLPMGRRHDDAPIRRAEEWIHRHCREDFRFDALAGELGMSPRNFIRRFKAATGLGPIDYLQRLRVTAAKRLLEEDDLGVQEIGRAVGYEDAAFFRALFKRHTGLTPAGYRRSFASAGDPLRSTP